MHTGYPEAAMEISAPGWLPSLMDIAGMST